MYKFCYFLLLASIFCCSQSCKKDSNVSKTPSKTVASQLIGKWEKNIFIDTVYTGSNSYSDSVNYNNNSGIYYQFNNDGTGLGSLQATTLEKFNYSIKNSKLNFFNDASYVVGSVPPETIPGPPTTKSIIKLTDNLLILRQDTTIILPQYTERSIGITYYTKVALSKDN